MTVLGRDAEVRRVLALRAGVLVVTGEPGAGKSTLLDLAADAAGSAATRVLRVAGARGEADLPFAGLHQLLLPVLDEVGALPERQRDALLRAVGLDDGPPAQEPARRLLVGVALLTLLSDLAPLLLVVDDVQWLDQGTRDTLAFAARRIGDEPVAVLVAARDAATFPDLPTLPLPPLDQPTAARLLDELPEPPTGRHRARILAQAAGNPLGLLELARAGRTPGATEDELPLTDRLERLFAADVEGLPTATRHALLLAAADTEDLTAAHYAEALEPAERAGLIRTVAGQPRFRHPLVRSAIYGGAPLAGRRAAHRELAELLTDQPDRRAWHLAAASAGPDERVAAALEATASRAARRAGYAAATAALERAAELSPESGERARRLLLAAGTAVYTARPLLVERLAGAAAALSDDPAVLAEAALRSGQVLTLTAEHDAALTLLTRAAGHPALAVEAVASMAVAGYYAGSPDIQAWLRERDGDDPWTSAVLDPYRDRAALVAALPTLVGGAGQSPERLTALGAMAWLLDETALAVRLFEDALHGWRALGRLPTGLGCSAGWAYLDHGRWAEARLTATTALPSSDDVPPNLLAATLSLEAAALALPGETGAARERAERALALIDPLHSRAVGVRARWALGMAAVADGDHETAYRQFRLMFDTEGDPVHYHGSHAALAELAAASVRTGHEPEAAEIVQRAEKRLAGATSPRLHVLLHRARALLNPEDPEDAEAHFQEALGDPAGEQWPFERAQVLLDYAEWLRRQRRVAEARPKLAAALETFRRLGARPWIERAHGELRAAGVHSAPAPPTALTELTPQQQQIVRLAARGLSNREIGERLFLSPRTVGSHLYRSYPKLGVSARAQLRDLV
ncbi:MAG TPA: AAA family ATPase [Pseudonocardia sp.]|nr:AAA family ATPase [Pseudonocardia sp.]